MATTAHDYCTQHAPTARRGTWPRQSVSGGSLPGQRRLVSERRLARAPPAARIRPPGVRDQRRLEPRLCGCRLGMGRPAIQQRTYQLARTAAEPHGPGRATAAISGTAVPRFRQKILCPARTLGLKRGPALRSGRAGHPAQKHRHPPPCRAAARSSGLRAGIDGRGPGRGRDRRSGPGGVDG